MNPHALEWFVVDYDSPLKVSQAFLDELTRTYPSLDVPSQLCHACRYVQHLQQAEGAEFTARMLVRYLREWMERHANSY